MKTGLKIYIAAPYTRPDPVENTHKAVKVADRLWTMGFIPFVPHLSMLFHAICPRPYSDWTAYDLHWLEACDAVLRLPGESPGADAEVQKAESLRMPVFYDEGKLACWGKWKAGETGAG